MGRGSFERNFLSEVLIEKNSKLSLVNRLHPLYWIVPRQKDTRVKMVHLGNEI
jgi:hypothetical protein